ncbi:MAG TPA: AsmA family protein, partial [Candidatus Binatia bacterium]|nr:AsmA family protein [Candidatus Binatia bacterium]
MRKWIILVVMLAVVVGAIALALANLNAYLNRNKDWLAGQVADALGRRVSFSEIGVQLFGGFGARIRDLRIADDPAFSKDDFVKAGDVQVSIRLLPALFGRYDVKRVALVRPEVTVVRTKEGFNYDSIGKKPHAQEGAPAAGEASPKAPSQEEGSGQKAAFLVSLVDIQKGQIRYIDRTTSPPGDVRVRDLDFA